MIGLDILGADAPPPGAGREGFVWDPIARAPSPDWSFAGGRWIVEGRIAAAPDVARAQAEGYEFFVPGLSVPLPPVADASRPRESVAHRALTEVLPVAIPALALLGASPSLGTPSLQLDPNLLGPALTPEQLSKLDRRLTPDEQKQVDAWQSGQSAAMQAAEEKKGGVRADMDVKPKEATVAATIIEKITTTAGGEPRPWWHYALMGGGALLVGAGTVGALK